MLSLSVIGGIACIILAIVLPLTLVGSVTCGSLVWSNAAQACVHCDAHHHCPSGACGAGNVCEQMTCNVKADCLPGYNCTSGICTVPTSTAAVGDSCDSSSLPVNPQFCNNTGQGADIVLPARRSDEKGLFARHYSNFSPLSNLGMVPIYSRGDQDNEDWLFNVAGPQKDGYLNISTYQVQALGNAKFILVAPHTKTCIVSAPLYGGDTLVLGSVTAPGASTCVNFEFVSLTDESVPVGMQTTPAWQCGSPGTESNATSCIPTPKFNSLGGAQMDNFIVAMEDTGGVTKVLRATVGGANYYLAVLSISAAFGAPGGTIVGGLSESSLVTQPGNSSRPNTGRNYLLYVAQGG